MGVTRYDIAGQARFLTFSCYARLPLLNDSKTRDAFAAHLELQRQRLGFRVIAWVVMPEHAHLILLPEGGAIGPVLRGGQARVGAGDDPAVAGARGAGARADG